MEKFVFPNEKYEQKALEFIKEFREHSSKINGSGALDSLSDDFTYSDWLTKVMKDLDIANIPEGMVPAYTYFYVREEDDRIVGMINIRLALNDFLRTEGGHIGYCVRPTERCKGFATKMLKGALQFCATIGLRELIITCDKDNPASASVIKNNGGVLDAEYYSDFYKSIALRYKIYL